MVNTNFRSKTITIRRFYLPRYSVYDHDSRYTHGKDANTVLPYDHIKTEKPFSEKPDTSTDTLSESVSNSRLTTNMASIAAAEAELAAAKEAAAVTVDAEGKALSKSESKKRKKMVQKYEKKLAKEQAKAAKAEGSSYTMQKPARLSRRSKTLNWNPDDPKHVASGHLGRLLEVSFVVGLLCLLCLLCLCLFVLNRFVFFFRFSGVENGCEKQ
jgi:hypothetical protein